MVVDRPAWVKSPCWSNYIVFGLEVAEQIFVHWVTLVIISRALGLQLFLLCVLSLGSSMWDTFISHFPSLPTQLSRVGVWREPPNMVALSRIWGLLDWMLGRQGTT